MSDKVSVANTKSDASPNHQNDISAQAIATKILTEVSNGLSGKDATAGTQAQNDLANLMTDPLQHQVLNQIATDMNDSAMMKTLGLTGSVNQDDLGNVTSLSFTSDAGMQALQQHIGWSGEIRFDSNASGKRSKCREFNFH